MANTSGAMTAWMRRLRWALASLPPHERDDTAREVQSHIDDLIARGVSVEDALARFGEAHDYARALLDEREIASALGSEKASAMLSAVGRRAHRNVGAALAMATSSLLAMLAFVSLLAVALKIANPAHVGLWSGSGQFFLGWIDDPSTARDVLGNWLYPIAALICAAAWPLARSALVAALRVIVRAARLPGGNP